MAEQAPPPPPPTSPPPPGGPADFDPIPWEKPGIPFLNGLLDTIKLLAMSPGAGFRRVPINADFLKPLLYLILIGWVAAWVDYVWQTMLGGVMEGLLGGLGGLDRGDAESFFASAAFGVMMAIFYPVTVTIVTFISSAITHLFLMLVGGANEGYFATFRINCYAGGTAAVATLIPLCGSWISGIWSLVLLIIGLAIAHRTTQGKAALAVLLPVALICLCLALGSCIFGAALFGLANN